MNEYVSIFKALGDETRLRVLMMLKVRPLCVCELSEALDIPLSTLSAHLKILKASGLVADTKDGRWVVYDISEGKELSGGVTFVRKTLDLIEAAVENDKKFLVDRAVIAKVTRELCSFKMQERRSRLSARKRQAPRIS
jgi:ArsR family transcriptional regulator, arsenate/arsenite/antimonite-responsive transcriptional repressor